MTKVLRYSYGISLFIVTILVTSLVILMPNAGAFDPGGPPAGAPPGGTSNFGVTQALVTGQNQPVGMTVDAQGTLYWVNWGSGQLLSLRKGSTSPSLILSGLNSPQAVGTDASGTLYYSEYFRGTISVLPTGSVNPSVLLSGLTYPNYLSVDDAGNVYFIQGETCGDKISKYDRSSMTVTTLITAPGPRNTDRGFGGIFIHSSGDLYYTTCRNGTIERLPKGSTTPEVVFRGQITNGIAVDGDRNIFFTDYYTSVSLLAYGTSNPVAIATQGNSRNLLTIDRDLNVYYNDNIGGVLWKVQKTPNLPKIQQVPVSTPELVDTQGILVTNIQQGQLTTVQARVRNNDTISHTITYIVQVKDSNGIIESLAWVRDLTLVPGSSVFPGSNWRPSKSGTYTVEVYIWNSLTNSIPLSPVGRISITVR
ncbi:MAG: hypothetical protein FJ358_00625 [Thaumarchaeota archaeon]|nr:hypothetical protein [Nitrososphaerota archaeon]